MSSDSQSDNASPYSPPLCLLLLLVTAIAANTGAVIHLCHLAQGPCGLAVN